MWPSFVGAGPGDGKPLGTQEFSVSDSSVL